MLTPESQAKLDLLSLIEKTDAIPEHYARVARKLGPHFTMATTYIEAYESNLAEINEILVSIGGLWMHMDAGNGLPAHDILVGAWDGRDIEDPDLHSWQVFGGADVGQITLHPDAIEEARQKILGATTS